MLATISAIATASVALVSTVLAVGKVALGTSLTGRIVVVATILVDTSDGTDLSLVVVVVDAILVDAALVVSVVGDLVLLASGLVIIVDLVLVDVSSDVTVSGSVVRDSSLAELLTGIITVASVAGSDTTSAISTVGVESAVGLLRGLESVGAVAIASLLAVSTVGLSAITIVIATISTIALARSVGLSLITAVGLALVTTIGRSTITAIGLATVAAGLATVATIATVRLLPSGGGGSEKSDSEFIEHVCRYI